MSKPAAPDAKLILVRPRKKGKGDSHGSSAWKIALADFMTAMLALFMVLWATSLDEETKQGIESYFSNPIGIQAPYSSGILPLGSGSSSARPNSIPVEALLRQQVEQMEQVGDRIRERLNGADGLGRLGTQVEIVASKEGLRIELLEADGGENFFPFGSAVMKPVTQTALEVIAAELRSLRNTIIVEGHTDAAPFGSRRGYSNWELSSDRAHAARRVLEARGVEYDRIREVRGYADKQLRVPSDPLHASNRRISILLPLMPVTPERVEYRGGAADRT